MSVLNPLAREISTKIVYYGPGLSGKTTSLRFLYSAVRPERRGELVTLATEGDRTLFFDFLPVQIDRVQGLPVRLQLYTVPGQVFYAATRKLVLKGADAVVFVADSQVAARDANRQSLDDLRDNLRELGVDLTRFPHVFQYNKRDLEDILPVTTLSADLNLHRTPEVEASAAEGRGVLAALKEVTRMVVQELKNRQERARPRGSSPPSLTGEEDRASIVTQLSEAAERRSPCPPGEAVGAALRRYSFAALWGPSPEPLVEVEHLLGQGAFGPAARAAAAALAEILRWLPGGTSADGPISKATLLGIDRRDYMRMCRLASAPEGTVTEGDALFALLVLVTARIRSMGL